MLLSFNHFRGLLDDATFHESVRKVMKDPIPYFAQVGSRQEKAMSDVPDSPPSSPVATGTQITSEMVTTVNSSTPTSGAFKKKKSMSKSSSAASQRSAVSIVSSLHTVPSFNEHAI